MQASSISRPAMPTREPSTLLGRLFRGLPAHVAKALFRVHVVDRDSVPEGGAILAGNHVSYGDPMLLWCAAPRHVHFMAKSELWDNALLRWALPRLWSFPIHRGQADREALSRASELLRSGELVGLFPEGTRRRSPDAAGEAYGGAAFLAIRNGVPVVPVGIAGTEKIRPEGTRSMHFPRVTIVFGEPLEPSRFAEGARRVRTAAMTDEIMRSISAQVERARGV